MKEKEINYDSDVFVSGFNYGYSIVSKYPEVLSDNETYLSGIKHGIEQYEKEIGSHSNLPKKDSEKKAELTKKLKKLEKLWTPENMERMRKYSSLSEEEFQEIVDKLTEAFTPKHLKTQPKE